MPVNNYNNYLSGVQENNLLPDLSAVKFLQTNKLVVTN